MCCSRPAAAPPNMNTTAASTQATTGQRARAPIAATDNPPIKRCAWTRRSNARSDGAGSNSAYSTISGAKISDCGSATLGCPP